MLICVTNRCSMRCAHCLQDSTPDSTAFMSVDTFRRALTFGRKLGIITYNISGGEPSEHPELLKLCKMFDFTFAGKGPVFSICSNGMWLKDTSKICDMMEIVRLKTFFSMQVYSNLKWYREYDFVVSHTNDYKAISPKIIVDTQSSIRMQDLGRARFSEEAQKDVITSNAKPNCVNGTLVAKQAPMNRFGRNLGSLLTMCKPTIDPYGGVHPGESILCPSIGNVWEDTPEKIYENYRRFKPCGKCHAYKVLMNDTASMTIAAREMLGLK